MPKHLLPFSCCQCKPSSTTHTHTPLELQRNFSLLSRPPKLFLNGGRPLFPFRSIIGPPFRHDIVDDLINLWSRQFPPFSSNRRFILTWPCRKFASPSGRDFNSPVLPLVRSGPQNVAPPSPMKKNFTPTFFPGYSFFLPQAPCSVFCFPYSRRHYLFLPLGGTQFLRKMILFFASLDLLVYASLNNFSRHSEHVDLFSFPTAGVAVLLTPSAAQLDFFRGENPSLLHPVHPYIASVGQSLPVVVPFSGF